MLIKLLEQMIAFLHNIDSSSRPLQFRPPKWGLGLSHARCLVFIPLPQVRLHVVQAFQEDQPPCPK